mmetsp:Transcript_14476/g.18907  ORF Transcript_14476/g.18907 Transcript_14476/m.18907 type:complete len:407 (+) Transcript_14476:269-1489(+)
MDIREVIAGANSREGGSAPEPGEDSNRDGPPYGNDGDADAEEDSTDGEASSPARKKRKSDRHPGKPKNTLVWEHIIITEQPSGVNDQKCKYCDKVKLSKQLQTTFWTMHLVDPAKGCPNCPLEVRQALAANSRSADVHRAASMISDQTPAMLAAKMHPPIRRKKKSEGGGGGTAGPSPSAAGTPSRSKSFHNQMKPTIVGICGSQRTGSFNKMLFGLAMQQLSAEGANAKEIDLKALDLPIYDADLEKDNFPQAAKKLKADLVSADGIIIVCPEYNGFVSPLLLNAITWATRGEGRMYAGFKDKFVTLMSASPGTMGGVRMLRSLQQMMQDMGAIVVPGNNSVGNAFQTFDLEGQICDERALRKVETAVYQLVRYTRYQANRDRDAVMDDTVVRMHNMGEYGRVDW